MTFQAIVLIHILACITPGPALLYALDTIYERNLKDAIKVVIGIVIGNAIEILLSVSGVSILGTIGRKYPKYFYIACASLLLFLGVKSILCAFKNKNVKNQKDLSKKFIATGFFITLLNPKALVFWAFILYPVVLNYTVMQKIFTAIYFITATFALISLVVFVASVFKEKTAKFLKVTQASFGLMMVLFASFIACKAFLI